MLHVNNFFYLFVKQRHSTFLTWPHETLHVIGRRHVTLHVIGQRMDGPLTSLTQTQHWDVREGTYSQELLETSTLKVERETLPTEMPWAWYLRWEIVSMVTKLNDKQYEILSD